MAHYEVTHQFSNEGTRNEVRMRVVNFLAMETPGRGKGELASNYIYYVESMEDGRRVYLRRPAWLHNGFDFVICVENMNYDEEGKKNRNNPSHADIEKDLEKKKSENPIMYEKLYILLKKVFDCHDVMPKEWRDIRFHSGLSCEHILKVIKWLFIEQDIRYWNYAGRDMTWNIVPSPDI